MQILFGGGLKKNGHQRSGVVVLGGVALLE